jgi:hypothetical protein
MYSCWLLPILHSPTLPPRSAPSTAGGSVGLCRIGSSQQEYIQGAGNRLREHLRYRDEPGFASSLSRSEPSITGQWTHLHTRPRSPPLYALPPSAAERGTHRSVAQREGGRTRGESVVGCASESTDRRPTPPYRRLIAVPEMLSQAVSSTLNVLLLATSNSAAE